jgi:hypothetical protein
MNSIYLLLLTITIASAQPMMPMPPTNRPYFRSINLEWNPSPSTNVSGYFIYYGTNSGTYISFTNTPNTNIVLRLTNRGTLYVAASATNTTGVESILSDELVVTVKTNAPKTNCIIRLRHANSLTGPWTTILTTTNDLQGVMGFFKLEIE